MVDGVLFESRPEFTKTFGIKPPGKGYFLGEAKGRFSSN